MSQPQAAVGAGLPRVDARLKVTGGAKYAADNNPDGVVHAVIVESSIGRGRITGIDTRAAEAEPGVLKVISHLNAPKLPPVEGRFPPGKPLRAFQDDRVQFFGQPVAVAVATTLEIAQHAASLVKVSYAAETSSTDLSVADAAGETQTYARGDADRALGSAPVRLESAYRTARNHHNPMEPAGIVAHWDGDRLTVWEKTQYVQGAVFTFSGEFGIPPGNIRVISPFIGGAFGNAARTWVHSVIAAMAAREVKRPVKLVLTRRQMYFTVGFRPAYEYGLRLGADRGGRLTASTHDVRAESSRYETYSESVLVPGRMLYSTPNVRQAYDHVPLDVSTPMFMRGPGYASGAYPVESAMDELAHELGVDPIELRLRNEPADDESSGLPFSTRRLRECYRTGAREFGWHRRNPKPRSKRDGDWLIGMGMAAGVYDTMRSEAQASVRLDADGTALVQSSTSDMGPGTATSMSQVAADALGLTMRQVTFRLGDSLMPPAAGHFGSQTMASVGSAVQDGCDKLRKQAITLAVDDEGSPLYGTDAADIVVRGGRLYVKDDPARGETYQRLLARNDRTHLEVLGSYAGAPEPERFSLYAYSAIFAEVAVDARLGLVRVRRMLGVYDAARIVNPRLADSQAIGAMTGGIGQALLEHTVTDHRDGRIVNANFADYLVPSHADIHDLKAIFIDGEDYEADPIGVKGLGEIVIVGVAPAIANAVFNATGRRIRELPITAEALL
ncbi:xanthine dehydrogenase family protein molybdopterin-binding subunit [Streptomyces europaeiscabiei]|uniref:Xanthine dehydrogenase family protein molybdopterin-binding subunit n=1 Tax=Streptomyces europaeiscabiei TaxID=146819 RepID=A0ABU4NFZ2_9ACTN|nr:xanthine dehydrogenase family protein molybdopterin-binding subunit [Streptomyces europaeiscabiei]MDX2529759.1 xanthine dehydrogenase family protein molybdopterin-binding subunit [Streptomyces europaeiscabiei]MDX2756930.1 xanthine dehydrogenase family protein molybdopterin-binding subunit [Streptomyces europaeiscabiei]MDX2756987.1 xanthine dehydrogenase family protein molybdopterin-binding subunit [Streptomyces europaeiscabiei]MDX3544193.1 xanthine dehydrogenase family protein molybdopterin-